MIIKKIGIIGNIGKIGEYDNRSKRIMG